jgi:beta-xylosidase
MKFPRPPLGLRVWAGLLLLLLAPSAVPAQPAPGSPKKASAWGTWATWGDQGDGTYRNPVLPTDYSDIDCIRVGPDYYAISSTFQFSPGLVILHSRDLVNWEIAGHAVADLTQISPELNWDRMNRYSKGIWAGSIRYHDGKFWIYFGTPDEGYFMTTAKDIAGPWAPLHQLLNGPGWDDCCPFWDDDGQGYFIGSSFHDGYKIHLWKLSPDGRDLVAGSDRVIHQSKGSEANKLYKINGLYYHLFSEVKSEGRVVMMERSKNIFGPYEPARPLNHADKAFKEPNQGGLVQTEQGDWYWFTHHGTGDWAGRMDSLLPVTWTDGWPILGAVGADGVGRFVWSGKMPVAGTPVLTPQTSDEFNEASLPPQWEWNYQPRPGQWSLSESPGSLRLHAFPPLQPDNLLKAGDTLTQRCFATADNVVVTKLDLRGLADGQVAGLCHFSKSYSFLGVARHGGQCALEFNVNGKITAGPAVNEKVIWLKSTWGLDGLSQYSYSVDGQSYTPFGKPYPLAWGYYRGDRIGLFTYNNKGDAGYVDFDFFHYTFSGPPDRNSPPSSPAALPR